MQLPVPMFVFIHFWVGEIIEKYPLMLNTIL